MHIPAVVFRSVPLVATLLLGACAAYVNIPPQPGDVAAHDPNLPVVQQAQFVALQASLKDKPVSGSFQLILPEGTDPANAEAIAAALGDQATLEQAAGLPTVTVKQIRIRGLEAQVDLVRPDEAGTPRLVTVTLEQDPVTGWHPQRLRVWQFPLEQHTSTAAVEPAGVMK